LDEGQLAVFGAGDAVTVRAADSQPAAAAGGWEILVLGGLPIREPVARYGPFLLNTKAAIIPAVEDDQARRMGTLPAGPRPPAPRPAPGRGRPPPAPRPATPDPHPAGGALA